jgi:hypothetical protein
MRGKERRVATGASAAAYASMKRGNVSHERNINLLVIFYKELV